MATKASTKKQYKKAKPAQEEKAGFNLEISTDAQIAMFKGVILGLVVVAMVILAYHNIFEPVVWSSLMTIAGYVAFANVRSNANVQR